MCIFVYSTLTCTFISSYKKDRKELLITAFEFHFSLEVPLMKFKEAALERLKAACIVEALFRLPVWNRNEGAEFFLDDDDDDPQPLFLDIACCSNGDDGNEFVALSFVSDEFSMRTLAASRKIGRNPFTCNALHSM